MKIREKRKTILFLHSSSDVYGSGRILSYTIEVCRKNNIDCIVCLPDDGLLSEELRQDGVEVHVFDLGILRRRYYSLLGIINRFIVLHYAIARLVYLILHSRVNVVFSNTTAVYSGAIAAFLTNRPHIWHIHEIILSPVILAKGIAWSLKHMSRNCIAVSQSVKDHWDKLNPKHKDKLVVIYNGIPNAPSPVQKSERVMRELKLDLETVIIGMIGRVHYWKGQDYFLEIAHRIHSEYPDVKFIMAGDAFPGYEYLYSDLEVLKQKLGLTNSVIDLGFRNDALDVMSVMDIFVLPSTQPDPFPTVILEAMRAGKPVIATAHGGAPEMIVHNQTGFLIPWNDPQNAFNIMRPLIRNADLRKDFGNTGTQRLQLHFSHDTFNVKMLQLLNT